jgi:hypothetical protein
MAPRCASARVSWRDPSRPFAIDVSARRSVQARNNTSMACALSFTSNNLPIHHLHRSSACLGTPGTAVKGGHRTRLQGLRARQKTNASPHVPPP